MQLVNAAARGKDLGEPIIVGPITNGTLVLPAFDYDIIADTSYDVASVLFTGSSFPDVPAPRTDSERSFSRRGTMVTTSSANAFFGIRPSLANYTVSRSASVGKPTRACRLSPSPTRARP